MRTVTRESRHPANLTRVPGPSSMTRTHEIGRSQSCGYLLAVEESADYSSGMGILGASGNIVDAEWVPASSVEELLGKDIGHAFRTECVETVRSLVTHHKQYGTPRTGYIAPKANTNMAEIHPFRATHAEIPKPEAGADRAEIWTCTVAGTNTGVYLVDVEPSGFRCASAKKTPGLLQLPRLLGCIPVGASPQASTSALCDGLLACFPAFDKVMVYRFTPDGTGEVTHASIRPGVEEAIPDVNDHFPASGVLSEACEMLMQNGFRFIADTEAPSVPVCMLDERVTNLDLFKSALRAPAECHLSHLRKTKVRSCLLLAIVVDGELWGVYCCHSYSAVVYPSCGERIMSEVAATITASLISGFKREEMGTTVLSLSRTLRKLGRDTNVAEFFSVQHEALLGILDVDTIVLSHQSRSVTVYGNKGVSLTMRDCEFLHGDCSSDSKVLFRPLEGKEVAFFSVRSLLVVFLRGEVVSHADRGEKPVSASEPDGEEVVQTEASLDAATKTTAGKPKAWSPADVDLLKMVSHVLSSFLYAESLPADMQETFAHASHELRTPFHGVMGSLELLDDGHDSMDAGEQKDLIRAALECGGSMMTSLNEILDIAKDRDHREVSRERFVASSPLLLTMVAMKPFAKTEALELAVEIGSPSDGTLAVVGDERRIKAIVQNLVTNAIKFTPSGGKVTISLVVLDSFEKAMIWWAQASGRYDANVWMENPTKDVPEGSSTRDAKWHAYCVEDSGDGILPANLPSLAEAYKQISGGAQSSHKGTGLGLHICKSHVEAMNGLFGVASTASEAGRSKGGTIFAVVLPLFPAGAEVTLPAEPSPEKVVKEIASTEQLKEAIATPAIGERKLVFLVADDHKVNVKLLQRKIGTFFKGSGGDIKVVAASDGLVALDTLTALQRAQRNNADGSVLAGVFLDFHMPNLDGIECVRRARRLEADNGWPRTMICGCTADPTTKTRDMFQGAGGDHVISKPWQPGQVENVCSAMVQNLIHGEESVGAGGG